MEIRGKHDEHRDKSEPVTKFFIKNNILFSFSIVRYIENREKGKSMSDTSPVCLLAPPPVRIVE